MGLQDIPILTGNALSRDDFNNTRRALHGDVVPRNSGGTPTSAAGNLGTSALPWSSGYFNNLYLNGTALTVGGSGSGGVSLGSTITNGATIASETGTSGFLFPAAGNVELYASSSTPLVFMNPDGTEHRLTSSVKKAFTNAVTTNRGWRSVDGMYQEIAISSMLSEVDSLGSDVTAREGKLSAYKIGTELFVGMIVNLPGLGEPSDHRFLTQCVRGSVITGDSRTTVNRSAALRHNSSTTGTMLDLHYLFVDPSSANPVLVSTTEISYNYVDEPTESGIAIWFRGHDQQLMTKTGSTWVAYSGHYVGIAIVDSTGCVGTIPVATKSYTTDAHNSVFSFDPRIGNSQGVSIDSTDITLFGHQTSVHHVVNLLLPANPSALHKGTLDNAAYASFNFSDDLQSGLTYTASYMYFCYISGNAKFISDEPPRVFDFGTRRVYMHPYKNATCIATFIYENSSYVLPSVPMGIVSANYLYYASTQFNGIRYNTGFTGDYYGNLVLSDVELTTAADNQKGGIAIPFDRGFISSSSATVLFTGRRSVLSAGTNETAYLYSGYHRRQDWWQ